MVQEIRLVLPERAKNAAVVVKKRILLPALKLELGFRMRFCDLQ